VAEHLGVSASRVRQLILSGRLPSQQFGRDHLIKESDLVLVAERKTGRPSKKASATDEAPAAKPAKKARKTAARRSKKGSAR